MGGEEVINLRRWMAKIPNGTWSRHNPLILNESWFSYMRYAPSSQPHCTPRKKLKSKGRGHWSLGGKKEQIISPGPWHSAPNLREFLPGQLYAGTRQGMTWTSDFLKVAAIVPHSLLRENSCITEWVQDWSQKPSSPSSAGPTSVHVSESLKPSQSVKQDWYSSYRQATKWDNRC